MDYELLENGWYKMAFTKSNDVYTLVDALVLSPDEFANLTPKSFDLITQQRFDNYISTIVAMSLLPPDEEVV